MKSSLWSVLALVVCLAAADVATAQRPGGRGGFGRGPGGGGALGLLQNEQIRKELEIVDEQIEKLTQAQEEMREEMREMFSGLRELSEDERRERFAELREKGEELRQEMEKKVDKILMPNQRDRLNQIALQLQMQTRGTAGALGSEQMADTLGLTAEQQEKLRARAEEVNRELREKYEQMRNEAREKLLDEVLTSEQRAKLKSLIGDSFELERTDVRRVQSRRFGGNREGGDRDDN